MSISAKGPPWTYEAYAGLPSDGKRHEIVDGDHYMNPAPNLYHQTVSRRLQFQLYSAIELKGLGVVFDAPVDVQLTDHDIVQPDLVVVTNSKRHIMTPTKIKGIPDLLVEILSPSNPTHDTVTKRSAYERCLVPEYWMVDTEEHKIVQLILDDLTYRESLATDQITMHMPPHVRVDLTMVW
ncbi:MAG: Uma2 family endonuclease [Planctomycetales bacterium]|nr:Uma2 family endonuclease [Planctomycetales bacterium]